MEMEIKIELTLQTNHSTWLSKRHSAIFAITKISSLQKKDQMLATLSQMQDIFDTIF